jgi:Zn-dependent peptidase ImmA (M78 family)
MNLNKLYDWHFEDINGIYLNYDKINAIALNYDNLGTYIDEKCTLAHELGHYFTGNVYSLSPTKDFFDKAEYRVFKWCVNVLVPLQDLKIAIKNGYTTNYILAEYFDVSVEFMQQCLEFYQRKTRIF